MTIQFKLKSRYNGKRFYPGEQANIPEEVAKRLVNCGAAFFIEEKEVVDLNDGKEGEPVAPPIDSELVDSEENSKDIHKLLYNKFNKDILKEAAMEVGILVPAIDQKKDDLIALIIAEGKAEEVLALPVDFNE
ncbi:hypothetical protein CEQ21_24440 [Niallia circulans]|uniref:Uncharacterized protein n=1 Tax=Niallia circulans TaxID=1397 RepID=A0A553SNK1_NIACI|nr:hypothetical protein [Niallia circulans]TRZ38536.1 hypothetical protein CEQ21_24440 [Niallia circulans]